MHRRTPASSPTEDLGPWQRWVLPRTTHSMTGGLHPDRRLPHTSEFELYHNAFSLCSKKARMCLAELGVEYTSHHIDLIETGSYQTLSRAFLAVNPAGLVPVLVHRGHPVYESHEIIAYAAAHAPGRTAHAAVPADSRRPRMPGTLAAAPKHGVDPATSAGSMALVPADAEARRTMQRWVDRSSLTGDDPTQAMETSAGNCVPGLTVALFAAMVGDIPTRAILEGLRHHRLKTRPMAFLAMKLAGLERFVRLAPVRRLIHTSRRHMQTHLDALETQLGHDLPWIAGEDFSLADVSWAVILDRLREADETALLADPSRPRLESWWNRIRARPSYAAAMLGPNVHPRVVAGTRRLERARRESRDYRRAVFGAGADADADAG